jgi:hypothetical protein
MSEGDLRKRKEFWNSFDKNKRVLTNKEKVTYFQERRLWGVGKWPQGKVIIVSRDWVSWNTYISINRFDLVFVKLHSGVDL